MAPRQKPQTDPILDNSALSADPNLEKSKVIHALEARQFSTAIRAIVIGSYPSIVALFEALKIAIQKLGITPELDLAIGRKPRHGSDQFDMGSLITWVNKVRADDADSVRQLKIMHASAFHRVKNVGK